MPALGNGTPVSVTAGETLGLGYPGLLTTNLDLSGLSVGSHYLGFRTIDRQGRVSEINWLPVQVYDPATSIVAPPITAIDDSSAWLVYAEYFWDAVPALGNGTPVSMTAGETLGLGYPGLSATNLNLSGLSVGSHNLGFRTIDSLGRVSAPNWLPLEVFDPVAARLVLTTSGRGSVVFSPTNYTIGSTVTLYATNAGRWYQFLEWSDGNTNPVRDVVIGLSNNFFTAIFTNIVPLETVVLKEWERDFGGTGMEGAPGGPNVQSGHCIQQTADGGYIMGGWSDSPVSGNKTAMNYGGADYWVIKMDALGNKQWEHSFGGTGDDILSCLEQTADGGYVLGGYSNSGASGNKSSPNYGGYDFWVVRLDADGIKLWEQTFGGSGDDICTSVAQTFDGGFILGGRSKSSPSGNKTSANYGEEDYWVIRLDANGNKLWDQSFGGSSDDASYSLQQTADGGFVVGGGSYSGISGNKTAPNYGSQNFWVVRLDPNGNELWDSSYGGSLHEVIFNLQQTLDGGYIFAGYSDSPSPSGTKTSPHYGGYGDQDYWVVKIDANGNQQWQNSFGGTAFEEATAVCQANEGGYIIGGWSESSNTGNKTALNYGGLDYWLVKTDANGNRVWDYSFGGTNDDALIGLQQTSDGGLILCGSSSSGVSGNKSTPNYGGSDFWVIKLSDQDQPIGAPIVLVNGLFSPLNSYVFDATNSVLVSLQTSFTSGYIFYSENGTEPDFSSTPYTQGSPFTVSQSETVWAVAYTEDGTEFQEADPVSITILPDYPLTYSAVGGGTVAVTPGGGLYRAGTVVTLTATASNGWSLVTWQGDVVSTNNPLLLTMDSAKTVQAVFGTTTLTDTTPGGGSVAFNPPGGIYGVGTVVTLTATPSNGWTFMGWSGALSGTNNPCSLTMSVSNSVAAVFGTTITANPPSGGGIVLDPAHGPYAYGSTVRLVGVPATAKYFDRWFSAFTGPTNSPLDYVVVTNNPVISAFFGNLLAGNFTLTTLLNGPGTVTRSPCANYYASNAVVTITALPNQDYNFAGWSGSASGAQNPLAVTMNSNKVITASFSSSASEQPLTVDIISPSSSAVFVAPTNLVLIANASDADGSVTQVMFTANSAPLVVLTNAPFTFTWTNAPVGTNVLSAIAVDNAGLSATSAPVSIIIVAAPSISVQPQNLLVLAGSNAVFSVAATGTQPLIYQWRFNGASLGNGTISSLALSSVQASQAGGYDVIVSDAGGAVTSAVATLVVNYVLNVSTIGNGTVNINPNLPSYAPGTNVLLTPLPARNWFFSGWGGDATGTDNPITVMMNAHKAISANFVTNSPPLVTLLAPTNGYSVVAPPAIALSAMATDPNGNLAHVDFYAQPSTNNAQPFLLASVAQPASNNPVLYSASWTNPAVGSYTLSAAAVDTLALAATSSPVTVTVLSMPATNAPVFQFSSAAYVVNENAGQVVLIVTNAGDLGGLVNYTTADGTAFGGSGYSGSYTIAQGSLLFANGQHAANIVIGIRDNFLSGPDIQFTVLLFNPSAGILGTPSTTTVTIHQNDLGGATNSLLTTASPTAQPPTSGALTVMLTPPEAGGQWRFPWERGWHLSGYPASSLEAGNYPVEFRNLPNYLAYPPTLTVAVTNNGTTIVTNQYWPTYTSFDTNSTGSLTVNIGPNAPAGSGWRFIGDSAWRPNNTVVASLLPDTYFIEYEPVSGWAKPASQAVAVYSGQATVVSANYLLAGSPPSGASLPSQVVPSLITDIRDYSYGFNGQLQSDVGFGSGVAVRETVVLTAAHLVFNDQTLSYVSHVWWDFQEEAGVFQPEPIPARGWYVLSGYAAQRTNDLQIRGYGIDQSSPQSREQDVAALYFTTPAARGGYGGYLASDAVPNPYLTGSNLKMLVGYPVDGSVFGQVLQANTMYATVPQPSVFTQASNDTYTASWFLSYPGNSGGPVYVRFNNYYYPAAVYLGTIGSGQNSVSVVRAINSDVVNLINLAASLGDAGTNNTGGGVLTITAGAGSGLLAYVQVPIGPAGAVAAGAAWRVSGTAGWSTGATFTEAIASGSSVTLEFKPIPGWNLPTNNTVQITLGQLTVVPATYTLVVSPLAPVLTFNPASGLGITGTTGATFRLEYRASLVSGQWLPLKTNTLGPGFNLLLPWPPTNGPAAFYRAVWLP